MGRVAFSALLQCGLGPRLMALTLEAGLCCDSAKSEGGRLWSLIVCVMGLYGRVICLYLPLCFPALCHVSLGGPIGVCEVRMILAGCVIWVQGSSVGKYGMVFSVSRLSILAHLHVNVGQSLSKLAWSLVLHETQWCLVLLEHVEVLCLSPHVLHVSYFCGHVYVRWFHPWHLRHLMGSFLHLCAYTCS